ncbi:hypothetical protein AAMO2058_000485500 [Amorphochlora amoebiformis]|uniref:Phosducin domain-containing protein n=1 Tax=Amorphochlora amoebiformis TaxID=1561963 RepID=A0A7S0D657_9EUKA|mmetsp:Transcript_19931/g.31602  ORF Transcript_19931/g.31602 Transcript_19931/m.31602 type:complete len:282 (+) Transcript_19931:13-858(+)
MASMADDQLFDFDTGPSQAKMMRQLRGIESKIEENSTMNGEFTENRGKTVWEDGLIAHGLKEAPPPTECEKQDEAVLKALLEKQQIRKQKANQRRERDGEDSDEDEEEDEDDEIFQKYRSNRLGELKKVAHEKQKKQYIGQQIETIVAVDFKEKVALRSLKNPVVMLIFRGSKDCDTLANLLAPLASKFPSVSFVRIEASESLRGVPKEDCPIVMVYKGGKVRGQFRKLVGFAGEKTTADIIEWKLSQLGIISTSIQEDPTPRFQMAKVRGRQGADSDDEL